MEMGLIYATNPGNLRLQIADLGVVSPVSTKDRDRRETHEPECRAGIGNRVETSRSEVEAKIPTYERERLIAARPCLITYVSSVSLLDVLIRHLCRLRCSWKVSPFHRAFGASHA